MLSSSEGMNRRYIIIFTQFSLTEKIIGQFAQSGYSYRFPNNGLLFVPSLVCQPQANKLGGPSLRGVYSFWRGLTGHMTKTHICAKPIVRLNYGHEWVFSGFVRSFRKIIDIYAFMKQSPDTPKKHKPFKRAIQVWNNKIKNWFFHENSCQLANKMLKSQKQECRLIEK